MLTYSVVSVMSISPVMKNRKGPEMNDNLTSKMSKVLSFRSNIEWVLTMIAR